MELKMTTFEIISLFLGGAGLAGILRLAFSFGKMAQRIEVIEREVKKIESIDQKLARLEGRFEERGYWESRRTGTERVELAQSDTK